jgi:vacuolar-type H+-ATPase subunit F/Vma7
VSEREVPVVLTDRLPAIGWQLAGARVQVVGAAQAADAFAAALATTNLLLVSAAVAAALPAPLLAAARRGTAPLVLVLDEALESAAARPAARHARGVLGVEA